ncbi:hypothetical protein BKA70DRAFT_1242481 [Coprinopsis sp. MPI-PUGE-AT-0042]|nr:hypothetical protein BKA70DRAFT_1242481 [Coprinopsis sp. MPI-PUGE-AT-0042]
MVTGNASDYGDADTSESGNTSLRFGRTVIRNSGRGCSCPQPQLSESDSDHNFQGRLRSIEVPTGYNFRLKILVPRPTRSEGPSNCRKRDSFWCTMRDSPAEGTISEDGLLLLVVEGRNRLYFSGLWGPRVIAVDVRPLPIVPLTFTRYSGRSGILIPSLSAFNRPYSAHIGALSFNSQLAFVTSRTGDASRAQVVGRETAGKKPDIPKLLVVIVGIAADIGAIFAHVSSQALPHSTLRWSHDSLIFHHIQLLPHLRPEPLQSPKEMGLEGSPNLSFPVA